MNCRRFLLLLLVFPAVVFAQVHVPTVIGSHMVVQRDLPVHVWGTAAPGESVAVTFRGETRTSQANRIGDWSVYLSPGAAGGPFDLSVQGTPSAGSGAAQEFPIVFTDILVGDLWLASGQSNMEFPLSRAATAAHDLPHASNPRIRLLMVKKRSSQFAEEDVDTDGWAVSNPDTAKDFSAAAWYFARDLEQREHVPVGVIDATWGGTVAESWVRLTALGEDAALMPLFVSRGKMTDNGGKRAEREVKDDERQREEAKAAGQPIPQFPWHPPLESWGPGLLWNGMIAPLTPLAIRGVIWYQGESNSALERAPLYHRIFRALIEDWRRQWAVGDFPFLYVQISNYKSTPLEDWAALREQQVDTLELRNTAMAVTIDIGNPDDVHPTNKLEVGLRLARAARALSYGEMVEYSGPLFRQATPQGAAIRAWFDHAHGLLAKGGELTGFEVAGADGKWVAATARIDGETVVASSPAVTAPTLMRYGWANSPQCNLFNGEGLPASPFRSMR